MYLNIVVQILKKSGSCYTEVIIALVYKIHRDNKKPIQNLNDMKSKLDSIIERLRAKGICPDEKLQNDIRCLQDMIFENRSVGPLSYHVIKENEKYVK